MTYKAVGPPNTVDGQHAMRVVATYINWEAVGCSPDIIPRNAARITTRFVPKDCHTTDEPVAVVGFGASLKETWQDLQAFKVIVTCSGSHKFLLERGIVPTYHVDSEPRPHKADLLGTPHRDVTYLISSTCSSAYFDLLEKHSIPDVRLWHLLFLEPHIYDLLPINEWLFTGGGTVGIRAAKMARVLGYTNLHFFGIDYSTGHADYHPNEPKGYAPTKVGGQTYYTTQALADDAALLIQEFDRQQDIAYTFHGDGMCQAMARQHVRVQRTPVPLAIMKVPDESGGVVVRFAPPWTVAA